MDIKDCQFYRIIETMDSGFCSGDSAPCEGRDKCPFRAFLKCLEHLWSLKRGIEKLPEYDQGFVEAIKAICDGEYQDKEIPIIINELKTLEILERRSLDGMDRDKNLS